LPPGVLEERLTHLGFLKTKDEENRLCFSRGSALADFSIKFAKIQVLADKPLVSGSKIQIVYGSFALFDTGDLWKFSNELKTKLNRMP
jgi:hypothetical protein